MALEKTDGASYQKILIYVILTVIFIRLFVSLYQWLKPRAMAWFLTKFAHSSNEAVGQIKSNVFASMKQIQKENGELVVLEIGAGTGANFNFFPESSKVLALEPNIHCVKYLQESASATSHVQLLNIIDGSIEDISAEVKDGSVDAVVGTYVLCSVNNTEAAMNEIKRVLKPNGKYYFVEHVRDEYYNSWTHIGQRLMHPIMKVLADCDCAKSTWTFIDRAGFKAVDYRQGEGSEKFPFFLRPHIYGCATK
uniref:Putative methyltransferase-like protein 7A n=1 Tax=Stichopus japonicus TaxID=307972 RepID=A0A2H4Z9T9_STIJA|nr:putative methyltransferase-like protein 7A [Apostichopus japonicus]